MKRYCITGLIAATTAILLLLFLLPKSEEGGRSHKSGVNKPRNAARRSKARTRRRQDPGIDNENGLLAEQRGVTVSGQVEIWQEWQEEESEEGGLMETLGEIELTLRHYSGHPEVLQTTYADDSGGFSFANVKKGRYVIEVTPTYMLARASESFYVGGNADRNNVDIYLRARISGTVVDPEGLPIENTKIEIWETDNPEEGVDSEGTTGPDGSFELIGYLGNDHYLQCTDKKHTRKIIVVHCPQTEVKIVMKRGGTLKGMVIRESDGAAVENFTVHVGFDLHEISIRSFSDREEGTFEITNLQPRRRTVRIYSEEYALAVIDGVKTVDDEITDLGVIAVNRGATFKIHVISEKDGTPIESARVEPEGGVSTNYLDGTYVSREFTTDNEGFCRITRLSRGGWKVKVYHKEYYLKDAVELMVDGSESQHDITIHLTSSPKLRGTVLSEKDKKPVQGARVFFGYNERTATDRDGRFEVMADFPGWESLSIRHEEFAVLEGEIFLSDGNNEETFHLQEGGSVRFKVVDSDGRPVKGCRCYIFPGFSDEYAETDKRGELTAHNVPPGKATAQLQTPNNELWRQQEIEVIASELVEATFLVGTGASIYGTATANGEPLEEARIRIRRRYSIASTKTNPEGMFKVLDILPGEYEIDIYGDNPRRMFETKKLVVMDEDIEVNFSLSVGAIKGTVTDEDGKPLPSVSLRLDPWPGYLSDYQGTNAKGEYSIKDLPRGKYRILASKEGYATATETFSIEGNDRTEVLDIQLDKETTISGRITTTDGPMQGRVQLYLLTEDGHELNTEYLAPDLEGAYELGRVPRGNWLLMIISRGYAPQYQHVSIGSLRQDGVDFELVKGKSLSITVKDDEGYPMPGARVSLQEKDAVIRFAFEKSQGDRTIMNTARNGIIKLRHLNPGTYEFKIERGGYRSTEISVPVDGKDASVETILMPE